MHEVYTNDTPAVISSCIIRHIKYSIWKVLKETTHISVITSFYEITSCTATLLSTSIWLILKVKIYQYFYIVIFEVFKMSI